MKKTTLLSAVSAAILLSSQGVLADEKLQKCIILKDGKNIIKAHKGDCRTSSHSCSGQNSSGEQEAFIMLPKGKCDQVNEQIHKGDFKDISHDIKIRIDM